MSGRIISWVGGCFALLLLGCSQPANSHNGGSANGGSQPTATVSPTGIRPTGSERRSHADPAKSSENFVLDGPAWFADHSQQSDIDFVQVSGNSPQKPFPAANGSGVAVLDYDLDGHYDLYFATGCDFPIDLETSEPINRIYRNLGNQKFFEVTHQTRLGCNGFSAGLAVGDFDADGFSDIYVSCFGPNILFRNQGDGTFERVESAAGVDDPRWGTSATFLDYDEDGLLDLYVCNYAKWTWEGHFFCGDQVKKIRKHCGPRSVEGEFDILYHNQGDGTFVDRLLTAGLAGRACRGQGVVAADINGDGHTDLYVGNDLHPNFLFINRGDGTFLDATESSGAAYDSRGNSQAGMGVDVADVNRDGRMDIFVTNFAMEYNTLYINMGNDFFQDFTNRFGMISSSVPWVGWGTNFVDFNQDGWLDLMVTNGHVDDNGHLYDEYTPYAHPPLLYRGREGKLESIGPQGGTYFESEHVGRGLAIVDLDNDGDSDVVINHQDAAPAILLNTLTENTRAKSSIRVRLIGRQANRNAIGSTVRVQCQGRTSVTPAKGGSSYLSSHDPRLLITVPADATDLRLQVVWPSGRNSQFDGLQSGRDYVILEPANSKSSASIIPVGAT